jgi:DNA helicase-2/ATP-dependent DNA helicase PcrA
VFEETLLGRRIPYRVHGGQRFYERAEIKDALGYLRLVASREDNDAFERVVNTPPRGFGERSLELLRSEARTRGLSLWQAALAGISDRSLPTRTRAAVSAFLQLLERLAEATTSLPLEKATELVIRESGLWEHYRQDKVDHAQTRIENLEELITATRQFQYDASQGRTPLAAFLAHTALEGGEEQGASDCVHLMTLHAAKGLEFPLVFLCGVEEGLFPHQHSVDDPAKLEEERRLCYVGITRAKQMLCLSYAEIRRLHGVEYPTRPSRFLREIPPDRIREIRLSRITYPFSERPGSRTLPFPPRSHRRARRR